LRRRKTMVDDLTDDLVTIDAVVVAHTHFRCSFLMDTYPKQLGKVDFKQVRVENEPFESQQP